MHKILFVILFFSFSATFLAANKIDSLQIQLNRAHEPEKVAILNQLADLLACTSPENSLKYANQALTFATKFKIKNEEAVALNIIGKIYFCKNEFPKALSFFFQSLQIADSLKDKKNEYKANCNIGLTYREMLDYRKSLEYFDKAIIIASLLGDSIELANTLTDQACNYYRLSQNQNALSLFQHALLIYQSNGKVNESAEIYDKIGSVYYSMNYYKLAGTFYEKALNRFNLLEDKLKTAETEVNIGLTYQNLSDFKKAIENYQSALTKFEQLDYKEGIATTLSHIGQVFLLTKNEDKAIENFIESLDIFNSLNLKQLSAWSLGNIATAYKNKKDFNIAISNYQKALQLQMECNDFKDKIATTLMNMGELYLTTKQLNEASLQLEKAYTLFDLVENKEGIAKVVYYVGKLHAANHVYKRSEEAYLKSIEMAKSLGNNELLAANYFALTDVYRLLDKPDVAFHYNSLFLATRDSIDHKKIVDGLAEMQIQYESEKKNKEIELLKKDSQIKEAEQLLERIIFIAIVLVLVSVLIFSYQYILRLKAYKVLVKKNLDIIKAENKIAPSIEISKTVIPDKVGNKNSTQEPSNESNILINQLLSLMKNESIYLDKEISLTKVSDLINTNRTYLSEAIHKQLNTNFNDFINEYRIKKSCILLTDLSYHNMTIEAIASMVGFSTKATFNNAFKKFTGVTPSYFKNNNEG